MAVKFSDFTSSGLNSTGFIVGYDSGTNQNIRIPKSTLDSTYQPTLVSGTNIKTINGSSVLGSGNIATASVNPTSPQIPYNNGGVFADSGITVAVGGGGLKNYEIPSSNDSGLSLALYPSFGAYSFGDASPFSFPISAFGGAAFTNYGSMVMGCGISNPTFGVFNVDASSGMIRMGNTASSSIGVNAASNAMYIGSYFSLFSTPVNPTTPVKWIKVADESNNTYYLPLYQ